MKSRTTDLLAEAIEVSAGRSTPTATEAEFLGAAIDFAQSSARPGEDAHASLLRLIVSGSSVIWLLYGAAEKASAMAEERA